MEFTEMKRAINKVILLGNLGRDSHCFGVLEKVERAFTFEPTKAGKGALNWANISDGAPESGGGGASASLTVDGTSPVAASSDDDDSGDADPEPARRRSQPSSAISTTLHPSQPHHGDSLNKLPAVQHRTGLSKSTIYALIKAGKFPEPVRLGSRCSRWKSSDLDHWLSQVGQ